MPDFTPDTYRILIVEDKPAWQKSLKLMYCRILRSRDNQDLVDNAFCKSCSYCKECVGIEVAGGKPNVHPNIDEATNADSAMEKIVSNPQSYQLISLDINLGTPEALGLPSGTKPKTTALTVFHEMQEHQRGAALVVITGANHDTEIPLAYPDREDRTQAQQTLSAEMQDKFPMSSRHFQKVPVDDNENTISNQTRSIEARIPRATLIRMTEEREKSLRPPEVPTLCLMLVLDDTYFEGHDESGELFSKPENRCVKFDCVQETMPYLRKVKCWPEPWPEIEDFSSAKQPSSEALSAYSNAVNRFYFEHAQAAFDLAARIALKTAESAAGTEKKYFYNNAFVLRSKPRSETIGRSMPPKSISTINTKGLLTPVHFEFINEIGRAKIISAAGGPLVSAQIAQTPAVAIRRLLRDAFSLRKDEDDPVKSKDKATGVDLVHYDIKLEVYICSVQYISPPPKPRKPRRKKGGPVDDKTT